MPQGQWSMPGSSRRLRHITCALVAAVPVAIALAVFFARTHGFPLLGDEPYF